MFNNFMSSGSSRKDFPRYDGPPSNMQHDSIDDLNNHFMKSLRNFGSKNSSPTQSRKSTAQCSDDLLDLLAQTFPHSTLQKKFWQI